jgi:hemerythrin superfamily protein
MFDNLKGGMRELLTGSNAENDLRTRLHADHHEVSVLLSELRLTEDHEAAMRADIRDQLMVALMAHARIEEEVVYEQLKTLPLLRELMQEAYRQHDDLDMSLDELAGTDPSDPGFLEVVARLEAEVTRHVQQEENTVLPRAEGVAGKAELAKLIPLFNDRKRDLVQQLQLERMAERRRADAEAEAEAEWASPVDVGMSESNSQF